jgi:hypothetical protein
MIYPDRHRLSKDAPVDALDQPWARIRDPRPIPDGLTVELLQAMKDEAFADLIRTHLIPRENLPRGRQRWEVLWELLRGDDDLAERAMDTVEGFLDAAEGALDAPEVDESTTRRAQKFCVHCTAALHRLELDGEEVLSSVREEVRARFNRTAGRILAQLVDAIDEHRDITLESGRAPTPADEQLWATLTQVRVRLEGVPRR